MIIKNSEHYSREAVEPKYQRLRALVEEYVTMSFSKLAAEPEAVAHMERLIVATQNDIIECGIACEDCKHHNKLSSSCSQYGVSTANGNSRICTFYFELAVVEHKPFQLF